MLKSEANSQPFKASKTELIIPIGRNPFEFDAKMNECIVHDLRIPMRLSMGNVDL